MKKLTMLGMIILLLLSVTVGVYAHSQQNKEENSLDFMDKMHEEMKEYVHDSKLREAMDDMHEGCEQFHGENRNTIIRSHMMGMGMI